MRIGAVTASKIAKKMQVAQGDGRFRIICGGIYRRFACGIVCLYGRYRVSEGGIYLRFVPLLRLRLHAARDCWRRNNSKRIAKTP